MAGEGLLPEKLAAPHLGVAVSETATGNPHAHISVGSDCPAEAVFGIEIDRGDGQPKGLVGGEVIRLVEIVEGVAANRATSLQGLRVTHLEQVPLLRVYLSLRRQNRGEQKRRYAEFAKWFHP